MAKRSKLEELAVLASTPFWEETMCSVPRDVMVAMQPYVADVLRIAGGGTAAPEPEAWVLPKLSPRNVYRYIAAVAKGVERGHLKRQDATALRCQNKLEPAATPAKPSIGF